MPTPPTIFSLAYRSPLWDHLLKIEQMLKKDATWKEITNVLREDGVDLTMQSIYRFYQRYASRKRPLPYTLRDRIQSSEQKKRKPKFIVPLRDKPRNSFIPATD